MNGKYTLLEKKLIDDEQTMYEASLDSYWAAGISFRGYLSGQWYAEFATELPERVEELVASAESNIAKLADERDFAPPVGGFDNAEFTRV